MMKINQILLTLCLSLTLTTPILAQAGTEKLSQQQQSELTADQFIQQAADELLQIIKDDPQIQQGDLSRINKVVDEKFLPKIDFVRITAASVGPRWRSASPEQRQALIDSFRGMLVKTYAAALKEVNGQTVKVLPLRKADENKSPVTVRSQVLHAGQNPVDVHYRLRKTGAEWLVYDVNVSGIWFVETYRQQFTPIINQSGIDGLIKELQTKDLNIVK